MSDQELDHKNQLDNSTYKIERQEGNDITFKNISYVPYSNTLIKIAEKHSIFDKYKDFPDSYVLFSSHCEHTGLHFHCIVISVIEESKFVSRAKHAAHLDGSLCFPSYDSFLTSKIIYYEEMRPDLQIYIHRSIVGHARDFHENQSCRGWPYCNL